MLFCQKRLSNGIVTREKNMSIVDPTTTLAQCLDRLGCIEPRRIRMIPPLGTATHSDVEAIRIQENRLFELVDGILVEKTVGFREALIAAAIVRLLGNFVTEQNLGIVTGADGMVRLFEDLVRIPDAAFFAWDRLPDEQVPDGPVPALVPTVAVEVLSSSNTPDEMARKRREYIQAGACEVWEINIENRTFTVYLDSVPHKTLEARDTLRSDQLPGFELVIAEVFAVLDRKES